jgi:hypothetical protein
MKEERKGESCRGGMDQQGSFPAQDLLPNSEPGEFVTSQLTELFKPPKAPSSLTKPCQKRGAKHSSLSLRAGERGSAGRGWKVQTLQSGTVTSNTKAWRNPQHEKPTDGLWVTRLALLSGI